MDTSLPQSLILDWKTDLVLRNLTQNTIKDYIKVAEGYRSQGGDLTPQGVKTYLARLLTTRSPAYAAKVHRTLRVFFRYLKDEGVVTWEFKIKAPVVPEKPVPLLPAGSVKALFKLLAGPDFRSRRDLAIWWVLLDTGIRASELVGMKLQNLNEDTILIYGKGRKFRTVVLSPGATVALRRYLRAREGHPKRDLEAVWLTPKGAMTYSGLAQMLRTRGEAVGITEMHPHRLRHQFAHDFLSAGGSEGDLMRLAGWSSRSMLERYGASGADERAVKAARDIKNRH